MMETIGTLPLFAGYGIELEYIIVDRDQHNVLPVTDQLLKAAAGDYVSDYEEGSIAWSNELVLHVIELKTNGPVSTLTGLPDLFSANIHRINKILANMNGRLMPAAMHPWMDPFKETRLWPHESSEIYDSYNRIFNCQGHGWSNLQSMHINLPFADDHEFALLHAAIRILLPIMPALAASSPIMDGQYSGLLDTRLEVYRRNAEKIPSITGLVIPEPADNYLDYQNMILQPMYAAIAPHDPEGILQYEWLNSRGAIARFDRNAIEIRVLDTQETPQADIAIAAMIITILKKLAAAIWSDVTEQNQLDTEALAELLMLVIKEGELATIANKSYLELFEFPDRKGQVQELWRYLLESISADDTDLIPELRKTIEYIIHCGPLARRIKQSIGKECKRSHMEETYRQLCDCLHDGQLFEGIR
ncbi:MAG: glutamate--cysteine ligase [Gammaproteobacteria bacterium RIFCSPLOWO2_12_47_11]|nr:MAG: glutamate--cysteine ligase [Gammaproteobacteria bacterium RIFCSPLOWO2_12_47_11]